jgi:short-subunit dehydrogenase
MSGLRTSLLPVGLLRRTLPNADTREKIIRMQISEARAVVTGAAGGLGGAIAAALHRRGATLVLTGRREDTLAAVAARFPVAETVVCDLADRGQVADLGARLGEVDIVVANAALPATGKLEDFTPDELDRALDVNLRAPMMLTQQLLPGMLRRGRGHFVYISSIAGKVPTSRVPIYSATKAGLRGFCASLRQDLHGSGVSASVVLPGSISDVGLLVDARMPMNPGSKGVTSASVARSVITAIDKDRAEVEAADAPSRVAAKLAGMSPGLTAHLTRRTDLVAWADQVTEGLRHLR